MRDIAEQSAFRASLQPFVMNLEAFEHVVGRQSLPCDLFQKNRGDMPQQRHVRVDHIAGQLHALVALFARGDFARDAGRGELFPVTRLGTRNVSLMPLQEILVGRHRKAPQRLDLGLELRVTQAGRVLDSLPRFPIGFAEQFVQRRDRVREQLAEAPLRFAFGQPLDEPVECRAIVVRENGCDRLFPQSGIFERIENPPPGWQAELPGEALRDLNEEAIERADAQPMQISRGL